MPRPVQFGRRVARAGEQMLIERDVTEAVRGRLFLNDETEGRPGKGAPRTRFVFAAGFALVLAVGAMVFVWSSNQPLLAMVESSAEVVHPGTYLDSRQSAQERVVFSDGSSVALGADTGARFTEISEQFNSIQLERGDANVNVIHRDGALWNITAGPYSVEVTGTRFQIGWAPSDGELSLAMYEGKVLVSGPGIQAPMSVVAGDVLKAWPSDERVALVKTGKAASEKEGSRNIDSVAERQQPGDVTAPQEGVVLTQDPIGAPKTMENGGVKKTRMSSAPPSEIAPEVPSPGQLMATANERRLAGSYASAREMYIRLRGVHPDASESTTAALLLGRLAFDVDKDYVSAIEWFDTYLLEARGEGPVREVQGRLIESLVRLERDERAALEARKYLTAYPDGPHAALAKSILKQADAD